MQKRTAEENHAAQLASNKQADIWLANRAKARIANKDWKLCPGCGQDYLREAECLPSEEIILVCPTCGHEDNIIPHDGACEWYDCRNCRAHIDPVGQVYEDQNAVEEGRCPLCGSDNIGMRLPAEVE